MSAPVDVLAVMARDATAAWNDRHGDREIQEFLGKESNEARVAVAELIEAADAALGVLGAYAEQIEGKWGVCLTLGQMLANGEEPEYAALRDSLARVRGAA